MESLEKLGALLFVIAPVGGVLKKGSRKVTVDRTLATARSIEFDAVLVAGGTAPTNDIKLVVLLQETFRHCKAMGAWGDGATALEAAGIAADSPGVLTTDAVNKDFTQSLVTALGLHRSWDRAAAVMASAVPPST